MEPETLKENYIEVANNLNENLDRLTTRQHKVVEFLGRSAKGFVSKQKHEAKAWLDKSLGMLELETNDIEYERKLLLMPEHIFNIAKTQPLLMENLYRFSEQLNLHLEVLEKIGAGIDRFTKLMEKLEEEML